MPRLFNEHRKRMKANIVQWSSEVSTYLPAASTDEVPVESSTNPPMPDETKARYREIESRLSKADFEGAIKIVEASYLNSSFVTPLEYEHNRLIEPFDTLIRCARENPETATKVLAMFQAWYERSPECPYAAALLASALHEVGFAFRGTGWASSVSNEAWKKLEDYVDLAASIFEQTADKHSNNWLWQKERLGLAISKWPGRNAAWDMFESAIALQPYNWEVYSTFANMLLPRWHGNYQQLDQLFMLGYERTKDRFGARLYETMFMQYTLGEEMVDWPDMTFRSEPLKLTADRHAALNLDPNLTRAAAMYALIGESDAMLQTLKRIGTFYDLCWFNNRSPKWCVAYALEDLKDVPRATAA